MNWRSLLATLMIGATAGIAFSHKPAPGHIGQPVVAAPVYVELDLRDCSPARVELSPIVQILVDTLESRVVGCTRYMVIGKGVRK